MVNGFMNERKSEISMHFDNLSCRYGRVTDSAELEIKNNFKEYKIDTLIEILATKKWSSN